MPGCGGCRWFNPPQGKDRQLTEEEKKKKAEERKEKPDFESIKLASLPDETKVALKPGHWSMVRCQLKANNFDFVGDLQLACVGRKATPLELPGTRYQLHNSRPVSLVKGQTKYADLPLFAVPDSLDSPMALDRPVGRGVPAAAASVPTMLRVNPVLTSRHLTRAFDFGSYPVTRLQPHQFYFLVLAANPDRYGFLKATTVVRPPVQDFDQIQGTRLNYVVTSPQTEKNLGLADSALLWTSTAYALWDGLDPDTLSPAQQTALLDWLHWGGQLIVVGPKSLEKLRLGFLQDFLPAQVGEMTVASASQIKALNEFWSIAPRQPKPERSYALGLNKKSPLQVSTLQLVADARFVPHTGQLVAERRVGRGRLVVTAFPLDDRRLINWAGFDSFLNNCLLRRPARRFVPGRDNLGAFEWKEIVASVQDSRCSSGVRYFSRDAASLTIGQARGRTKAPSDSPSIPTPLSAAGPVAAEMGYQNSQPGGIAAWTDFSSASIAARKALVDAAGISVPNGQFVMKLLGVYLICLIPINWTVFRVLQRVEWAWVAAPVIAILGALAVIKLAQLDIGFVRSRTEIAVVETQSGYPRAHITRFAGLYSSLSSRYDIKFDDGDGVALPFSADPSPEELRLAAVDLVEFRQQKENQLTGLPIFSNSTGLVHCEQMVELTGAVRLLDHVTDETTSLQIQNGSDYDLHSALILHRSHGRFQIYPVGTLERASTVQVALHEFTDSELQEFLDRERITRSKSPQGEVSLRALFELALDARQLDDGDLRLVAWSEQELDGITIKPRSSQRSTRIMWIHQLHYGFGADPVPDANLFEDVKGKFEDLFAEPDFNTE